MKQTYFITGISTDVGKTIASAICVEALQADYWKPIQAGELANSDTKKVQKLVSNKASKFHPGAFNLTAPMSPHAAAKIDDVVILSEKIKRPTTKNNLVIEGAGGLLVPLNDKETILDLIHPKDKVIVVSRHYLGSINHTLLTLEVLKQRNLKVHGIIFSGNKNEDTETIIEQMSGIKILGRIDEEPYFDTSVIKEYAERLNIE
ncbi:MAG: dethiobiotin synthetase [Flavobacteriaceae bacterium]|jgi:dethiobiotin synthetase|uniref:dethiobiotin synthase n=1 Tax=Candidatus Marifrigoribacter sp. Uisw_064 TaxID=3230970 RepID=UPI003AEA4827